MRLVFTILVLTFIFIYENIYAKTLDFSKNEISIDELKNLVSKSDFIENLLKEEFKDYRFLQQIKNSYKHEDNTYLPEKIKELEEKYKELPAILSKFSIDIKDKTDYDYVITKIRNYYINLHKDYFLEIDTLSEIEAPMKIAINKEKFVKMINQLDIDHILSKYSFVKVKTEEKYKDNKLIISVIERTTNGKFELYNSIECAEYKDGKIFYQRLAFFRYYPFFYEEVNKKDIKNNLENLDLKYNIKSTLEGDLNSKNNICNKISNLLPIKSKIENEMRKINSVYDKIAQNIQNDFNKIQNYIKLYPECRTFQCILSNIAKEKNKLKEKLKSGYVLLDDNVETTDIKEAIKFILNKHISDLKTTISGKRILKTETLQNFSYLKEQQGEKKSKVFIKKIEIYPYYKNNKIGVLSIVNYTLKDEGVCGFMNKGDYISYGENIKFVNIDGRYILQTELPFSILINDEENTIINDFINKNCLKSLIKRFNISLNEMSNYPLVCIKKDKLLDLIKFIKMKYKIEGKLKIPECKLYKKLLTCNGKIKDGDICKIDSCKSNFGNIYWKVNKDISYSSLGLYNLQGNAMEYCVSENDIFCIGGGIFNNNNVLKKKRKCPIGLTGIRFLLEK